ncbi:ecto-ADP-ribosyltransferase 5-like, partial [Pseudophryne corroboree]|uniref:ecto-ADP-ribosyltransferase 5-like n=1 Tax=Pseudophryne corroboree TaxID=495146 RepID=UPI00308158B7
MTCFQLAAWCLWVLYMVAAQFVQLGMYEDSFDDQYVGCLNQMEALAPDLLRLERQNDKELDNVWEEASEAWQIVKPSMKTLPEGFKDEYGTALLVHITGKTNLVPAVQQYGFAPQSFRYHSLQFYVTRAMILLRAGCDGKPLTTYWGTNGFFFDPPPEPQQNVRLGQIPFTATDFSVALHSGHHSFFNITTCFGVEADNFSNIFSNTIVIIPVNEVFNVSRNTEKGNNLILQSTEKRCSYYNCAYLGGRKSQICKYRA